MTEKQYLKNLTVPAERVDVVLDTDAYNEIDDQFAIGYMLGNKDRLNVKGICAAPFMNSRSVSAKDGMEKSYHEILKLLKITGNDELLRVVFKGSDGYMPDEKTAVESDAADFMANLANEYSTEKPLYIIAIGAITNVASAILKNPAMKEKCVVVWLGGHGTHMPRPASEFNMQQDIAAARVVFGCGVPLVQLPCFGVVDHFVTSKYELEYWLKGKNTLCDYLCENTVKEADSYAFGKPWTRVIWDVTAVAWLLNSDSRFMAETLIPSPIPEYDHTYSYDEKRHKIRYVYQIYRDALFEDLFGVLGSHGCDKKI
ncbi:MAG: nucleoside hydrolase [Clostridia bacterium]|nr:nucleoside hydrolase [Clostridia bacterium]